MFMQVLNDILASGSSQGCCLCCCTCAFALYLDTCAFVIVPWHLRLCACTFALAPLHLCCCTCAFAGLTALAHAPFLLLMQVIVVGLGDRQNAMLFSKLLDFPLRLLYAGEWVQHSLMCM